jgi:hypothetical protein
MLDVLLCLIEASLELDASFTLQIGFKAFLREHVFDLHPGHAQDALVFVKCFSDGGKRC